MSKPAVILEIGRSITRAGFSGEALPRCVLRTVVKSRATAKSPSRDVWEHVFVKKDNQSKQDEINTYMRVVDFLHMLFYKYLLVAPRERRVIVLVSILFPSPMIELIRQALRVGFHVEKTAIEIVTSQEMAVLPFAIVKSSVPVEQEDRAAGRFDEEQIQRTGLVVDLGMNDTVVVPIYESAVLHNGVRWSPAGSGVLMNGIVEKFLKDKTGLDTEGRGTPEWVAEELKCRMLGAMCDGGGCGGIVCEGYGGEGVQMRVTSTDIDVILGGCGLPGTVDEAVRYGDEKVVSDLGVFCKDYDNDVACVVDMVVESLQNVPIDTRDALRMRLMFVGGLVSAAPWIADRIEEQVRERLHEVVGAHREGGIHQAGREVGRKKCAFPAHLQSWCGASVYGCVSSHVSLTAPSTSVSAASVSAVTSLTGSQLSFKSSSSLNR